MWLLDCGPTSAPKLASSTLHFVSHAKLSACSVYTQKGQKTIGFSLSGNSDNKSGLIPDINIDVYLCNQLIQHRRLRYVSVLKISDCVNSC